MLTIGFIGYATAGKDTCAELIMKHATHRAEWMLVSFSDPLWESLLALNPVIPVEAMSPWRGTRTVHFRLSQLLGFHEHDRTLVKNKYREVRELLQRIGTDSGRNIHGEDCWIRIMRHRIIAHLRQHNDRAGFIFNNIRHLNEYEFMHTLMRGILVDVIRPGVGPVNGHSSDTGIDRLRHKANLKVSNDKTPLDRADLWRQLEAIMDSQLISQDHKEVLDNLYGSIILS